MDVDDDDLYGLKRDAPMLADHDPPERYTEATPLKLLFCHKHAVVYESLKEFEVAQRSIQPSFPISLPNELVDP